MEAVTPRRGFWVGFFFTINAIIGSGVLAVPWNFQKAGLLLGILLLLLAGFLTLVLSLQMLEIMSRIELYVQLQDRPAKGDSIEEDTQALIAPAEPTIQDRKFDMEAMFALMFGEGAKKLYMLGLGLTVIGTLTAYFVLFGKTMTAFVPIFGVSCDSSGDLEGGCRSTYTCYLLLYSLVMFYLCYRGYEEQITMQAVMAIARFVVLFLIVLTALLALAQEKTLTSDEHRALSMPRLWRFFPAAGVVFALFFLALSFHNTMPNTAQIIREKSTVLPKVMMSAVGITTFVFLTVGVVASLAVESTDEIITLEWQHYSASHDHRPWYSYPLAFIVVLFPAVDVVSVFPIYSIALSDNLIALVYGHDYEGRVGRLEFCCFRAATIAPPLIIAMVIDNFVRAMQTFILDITGLFGFLSIMTAISLLQIRTRRLVPEASKYDTPFGHSVSTS